MRRPRIELTYGYLDWIRNQLQKTIITLCQKDALRKEDTEAILQLAQILQGLDVKTIQLRQKEIELPIQEDCNPV